jgi:hypothetical protein
MTLLHATAKVKNGETDRLKSPTFLNLTEFSRHTTAHLAMQLFVLIDSTMKASLLVVTLPGLSWAKECDLFTYGNTKGNECGPRQWSKVVCEDKETCVSQFVA